MLPCIEVLVVLRDVFTHPDGRGLQSYPRGLHLAGPVHNL